MRNCCREMCYYHSLRSHKQLWLCFINCQLRVCKSLSARYRVGVFVHLSNCSIVACVSRHL